MSHSVGRGLAIIASVVIGFGLPSAPVEAAEALPRMVPGGVEVAEGDSGTTTVEVPVTLSAPTPDTVTTTWTTLFGPGVEPPSPATPGSDYTAASGTVTFAPGQTTQTITIDALGDTTIEPDEWIVVSFAQPTNATLGGYYGLGFAVLTDDDTPPRMVPGATTVAEGDSGTTTVEVPVTLSAPSPDTVTTTWTTLFGPGVEPPSPATPGSDYTAASGTITFAPGETTQTITIDALGDTTIEPDEWTVVSFAQPTNATLGGYYGLGFAVLTDDDTPVPTITVVPPGPLQGGDTVTVVGSGWTPGAPMGVCQAINDPSIAPASTACFSGSGTLALTTADETGGFSVTLSVDEWGYLSSLDRWVDCAAAPGCVIGAAELADIEGTRIATPPLPWTVPAPPVARGAVTVTPSTQLVDGQTVTVTGTGFRADTVLDVYRCLTDTSSDLGPRGCDVTSRVRLRSDATGGFSTPFMVHSPTPNDIRILAVAEAADWAGTRVQTDTVFGNGEG